MVLQTLPVAVVAALIFLLRVSDVCLGTIRTISTMHGRIRLAVTLGFFEVLIWVTAVSQVIVRLDESPWLVLAYAGGFATGNAVGILLERRLPVGVSVLRLVSDRPPDELVPVVRPLAHHVSAFAGTSDGSPCTLLYATCRRRQAPHLIAAARRVDPDVFYVIERFSVTSPFAATPEPTGWRAIFKKK